MPGYGSIQYFKNYYNFFFQLGTDSRIGFGYRLGDHADFQIQFEIGPQKETKSIGQNSSNKRDVNPTEQNKLLKELEKNQVIMFRL